MEKEEKPKNPPWIIWLYLIPVYILLLVLLAYWIKKTSTPEIDLTPAEESAFIAPVKIRQISPLDIQKSKEAETKIKKTLEMSPREKMLQRKQKREAEKKFKIIGSTAGKLIEAVEFAYKNPKAVKALFDNEIVVREFLNRETVKPLLENTTELKNFLITSPKVDEFLDNKTVTKVINKVGADATEKEDLLTSIARSKLAEKILTSPAVSEIINSPKIRREIIEKRKRLGLLTANVNLLEEIKSNPYTKHISGEYVMQ